MTGTCSDGRNEHKYWAPRNFRPFLHILSHLGACVGVCVGRKKVSINRTHPRPADPSSLFPFGKKRLVGQCMQEARFMDEWWMSKKQKRWN
jgi:hypothetical protein